MAASYGSSIVKLVSETVRGWDARTITDRLESAVGRDLQYIRINGTLVGGLVGVILHALDTALAARSRRSIVAPTALQLLLEPLIAAVEVVDAQHLGLALGGEAGEDQAHRGAQVGRHDLRAGQPLDAVDDRRAAANLDLGAHAAKLGDVHVAVLEDRLLEEALALGQRTASP